MAVSFLAFDLMRRGVIFCYPDDTTKQVAEIMHSNRIRSLAVVDEAEFCGSVSRNDLLRLYGKDLEKVKARECCSPIKSISTLRCLSRKRWQSWKNTNSTTPAHYPEPYTTSKRVVGILTSYDIVRYMSGIESGYYEHLLKIHKD